MDQSRFDQLQQGIDVIALDVERISEGQRVPVSRSRAGVRAFLTGVGLASAFATPMHAQSAADLDHGLQRLVADYTRLYTKDSLPRWRELFLPTFTSSSITSDSGVSARVLSDFYAAQERGFASARRMGERLENVRIERRGRMATVWADFVYWHDDDGRRGRLVLTAIFQRDGWRFSSLMFSYYD